MMQQCCHVPNTNTKEMSWVVANDSEALLMELVCRNFYGKKKYNIFYSRTDHHQISTK